MAATEEPPFTIKDSTRSASRRRFLVPLGVAVSTAAVGAVALFASGTVALPWMDVTVVRAMVASKRDFFEDAEVRRLLMAKGIQVHVTPVGSRDLANREDLHTFDFVMPSGQSTADLVRERRKDKPANTYRPFFTPLVLGTYRDYAEALVGAGVARPQVEGQDLYYDMSMPKLIEVMQAGKTWSALERPGKGPVKNGNRVVVQTPDPCASYSGSAYLGMMAFAYNGNQSPTTEEDALRVAHGIKPLFAIEGQHGDDLGPKYVTPEGRSFGTVMVIYEHQYLMHQATVLQRTGKRDDERVLLYVEAQHQTSPELLAFTPAGGLVGELVMRDPDLRRRAVELGFHVYGSGGADHTESELAGYLTALGLPVPSSGAGDTETWLPPLPLMEKMIAEVGGCR